MIVVKPNKKNSNVNKEHPHRLEDKECEINIDYISGLIDEEVAILKDEIEKQNIKIKKINKKLKDFEKQFL
jgi:hypothetical protein